MLKALLCSFLTSVALVSARAETSDAAAIEGWYAGDAARMERALHPDLAKRQVAPAPTAPFDRIGHLGAMALVQGTRNGGGTKTPAAEQRKDVTILDTFASMAMVRADMRDWVDYMQLAKLGDHWVIVNVLWERRPAEAAASAH